MSNQDKLKFGQRDDNILTKVFQKIKEVLRVIVVPTDSPANDAFYRLRVSNPQTLFDSKNIFNDGGIADTEENLPLFYDNAQISGAGTTTTYEVNKAQQNLLVAANTAGRRVRQTKMRFNYQPGKSQMIMMTFNLNGGHSGIKKKEGIFDDQNGIFLELNGTESYVVQRSYVTGTAVDEKVGQRYWNIDKLNGSGDSKIRLDFTKTQIMIIDYEWLGVGRVRIGFVIDGEIFYAHQFLNANNKQFVYMSTPNLPLRSEIENDGTGQADSISQICSSVMSEGGSEDLGVIRYTSTNGTHIDANTANIIYAVVGIRLKSGYIGASIKLLTVSMLTETSDSYEWMLLLNPTVAGTFTYGAESQSALETARGATANTITNGYKLAGGWASQQNRSISKELDTALLLGSKIDGTVDTIVLCVRPLSANADIQGSITWREIV